MKKTLIRNSLLCLIILMLTFTVGITHAFEDEEIDVECDRVERWGDDYKLEHIDNISINPNNQPTQICNQVFYNCRNNCVACVYNANYDQVVCVSSNGNRFVK